MKLNDDHIELLTRVRDKMYADARSGRYASREYICWNIYFVHTGIDDLPREVIFDEELFGSDGIVYELIYAIEGALGERNSTFSGWMGEEIDSCGINPTWQYVYLLGRLAWLDRMIEMREIA